MVLFWGVRPEGVMTSLPFLLPIGVELFLDASSAFVLLNYSDRAVLTLAKQGLPPKIRDYFRNQN